MVILSPFSPHFSFLPHQCQGNKKILDLSSQISGTYGRPYFTFQDVSQFQRTPKKSLTKDTLCFFTTKILANSKISEMGD
jgi:hypothetical protein